MIEVMMLKGVMYIDAGVGEIDSVPEVVTQLAETIFKGKDHHGNELCAFTVNRY